MNKIVYVLSALVDGKTVFYNTFDTSAEVQDVLDEVDEKVEQRLHELNP